MSRTITSMLTVITILTGLLSLSGCNYLSVEPSKIEQATFIIKRSSRVYSVPFVRIVSEDDVNTIWFVSYPRQSEVPIIKRIQYGKIPKTMIQLHPENGKSPRNLLAGEVIILEIRFGYDSILALGPVGDDYRGKFQYTKDGFFVKYKAPPE